ncbi:hypothetical protein Hypma_011715 [Hypsizygus marmoreus]|uniref:Uncharacterized protein n=1 Tax=Hypsizygus marmoreus TaxID=39966 RepID=A0A369JKS6_HYPMA|nr:hypothetical protein Hypma_011715 [Hypsizygus marmoreus]
MNQATTSKPANLCKISLAKLQLMLGWSDERFEALKKCAYTAAEQFLDSSKSKGKQEPGNWDLFRRQVLDEFIDLNEFDEQWPIIILFGRVRQTRAQSDWARTGKTRLSSSNPAMTAAGAPPSIASERQFVGKTPPRYRYRKTRSSPMTRMDNRPDKDPASPPAAEGHTPDNFSAAAQPSGSSGNSTATQHTSNGHQESSMKKDHAAIVVPTERYPVSCMLCGQMPPVPPEANREIRAALGNLGNAVQVLAALGIFSDHQLHTFWKWGSANFFDSHPQYIISPLYSTILKKHLIPRSDKQDEIVEDDVRMGSASATTIPHLIARPSREVEKRLVQHNSSDVAFMTAMGLERNFEDYHRFLRILEDKIKEEWGTPSQDDGRGSSFTSLINKACIEWPNLRTYEDHWPVRFYVQRRKARGQYSRQSWDNVVAEGSSSTSSPSTSNCPGSAIKESQASNPSMPPRAEPWSGCTIHPLPKPDEFSPKVREFLQSFGMEEMRQLFIAAKITDDSSFELLCQGLNSVEERLGAFIHLEHIKLNPFQQMMLRVMLKHLDAAAAS